MSQTIHSHTFENGLTVVGEPMPWVESAAFTFLVPAGCLYDPTERAGRASFACEMMLRGAGHRDSRQLVECLDNLGVERSEGVSDSHTSFGGASLATSLIPALEVYADILRRPQMPAEQFEAARQVVMQELIAIEDEPQQKVMVELRRRRYPSPWGRPSQGDEAGLTSMQLDDVMQHHTALFRPNGTILGVAGQIDWPQLLAQIERLFGDWQPLEIAAVQPGTPGQKIDHLDYEANQTQIGIAYPSVPYRDRDYFLAWAAVGALSGGMSSRFFTEVREKRGLCYSIYASYHTLRDWGSVLSYAGTSAERAQETLEVMLAELMRLTEGIEQTELDRLKARIKSSLIMQQESSAARSPSIARDWYHLDRVRTLEEVGQLVDALNCRH